MRLKYCLGLSIALNLALVVIFLTAFPQSHRSSPATPSDPAALSEASSSNLAVAIPRAERASKASATPASDWIQALRNAGISERLIADVAAADFESRWQKRAREQQKKFNRGDIDDAAMARFDLEHDSEQEKEMRAALGDDAFRRWDQAKALADFDRAGIELNANESDELYGFRKGLERKNLELEKARLQGKLSDEDAAAQNAAAYTQYNEQLMKLLGDERFAQVQSGGDTGLGELHRSLRLMNTDDTKVAGMETAQQAWNIRRARLELQMQKGQVTSDEFEKQMKALDTERDQEYQKVLGAEGFAEFQKTLDPRYQTMRRTGPGYGFTDTDLNSLYSAIQSYENNVRDYRERAQAVEAQGQPVDWPAVEKTLKEYSQQTENALRANLGDKFDKLRRSNVLPFER